MNMSQVSPAAATVATGSPREVSMESLQSGLAQLIQVSKDKGLVAEFSAQLRKIRISLNAIKRKVKGWPSKYTDASYWSVCKSLLKLSSEMLQLLLPMRLRKIKEEWHQALRTVLFEALKVQQTEMHQLFSPVAA